MLKKILLLFCLFLLAFFSVFSSCLYAQEENLATESAEAEKEYDFASMTTYELFWPITAGKIPGDKFYKLKIWRDKLVGYLFFDKLKKSEYLKQLANKRLVETEKLLEVQRYSYLSETLKISGDNLEKGLVLLFSAPETESQFWLRNEYQKDFQKHLIVLERMKEKMEEDKRAVLEEAIRDINNLIDRLNQS